MNIAFVVQRYGLEVNGGAELLCRLVAEKLSDSLDIEILTTCAKDYITWKNEYKAGIQKVNNIKVRRFITEKVRNVLEFNRFSDEIFCKQTVSKEDELEWINKQGPYCPELTTYIKKHKDDYDFFVFFTYLYYPTVLGLPLVASKSVLVPTAHDEIPIKKLRIFAPLFNIPKAIIYNTLEEKEFVEALFKNAKIKNETIGIGVNLPKFKISDQDFKEKYWDDKFIVYVGRIEKAKGLEQLLDYFLQYLETTDDDLKLLLFGKGPMYIIKHPNIIQYGYVSEQDKLNAMAAAQCVVIPSELESLSIVSLEAWLLKKPILVNGKSLVLRGSCNRSKGGLNYINFDQFRENLDLLLSNSAQREKFGQNGYEYVKENYSWPIIKNKYISLLESLR